MRLSALSHLACPSCQGALAVASVERQQGDVIETGQLACAACGDTYPIVRHIPRFVPDDNYAANFGYEWMVHARTQYDSHSGVNLSERRFFEETGWPRDMAGQTLLEVGSGSGRFTEQAAGTGAFVVSMDYSNAVEANYASNGERENVLIVQGDIYHMPLRRAAFDKVLCIGVLQHTPDPRRAFLALPPMLKPGGDVVVDIYDKTFFRTVLNTKYYLRRLTRGKDPRQLYEFTHRWVDLMWPLSCAIRRIPRFGPAINWRLLVPDYSREGLRGARLKEWAYLDAFDMLSPAYDSPATLAAVREWFAAAGMDAVAVRYGYNGIEGHGTRPVAEPACAS